MPRTTAIAAPRSGSSPPAAPRSALGHAAHHGHLGAALGEQPPRLTPQSASLKRAPASLSPPGRPLLQAAFRARSRPAFSRSTNSLDDAGFALCVPLPQL